MNLKILVTGANGQVGSELRYLANLVKDISFTFVSKAELDISNETKLRDFIEELNPDWIINCAAYTAVDKAEEDSELCHLINTEAVGYLAKACTNINVKLVHISSDYVYHINSEKPLLESDQTEPKSVYASSKLQGEKLVLKYCTQSIILRTSWVYSSFGNNFVKTMLRLGKTRDDLTIVSDQIGSPTYARDLARVCIHIIKDIEKEPSADKFGVFNYSNEGITNWKDFAAKIFEIEHIDCLTSPTTTEAYGAKAARPLWSVLSKDKIKNSFGIQIPQWEDSLRDCLQELAHQQA